jgi:DNA mismatch endonuclease (patch repair protein)
MQAIKGKNTAPELVVRKLLFAQGFRYRLHVTDLPGVPDVVLPKYRTVVFVHGCFWHGHGCLLFKLPQTRTEFWRAKIGANTQRDTRSQTALINAGWRVVTVWECALKGRLKQPRDELGASLGAWIRGVSGVELQVEGRPAASIESDTSCFI